MHILLTRLYDRFAIECWPLKGSLAWQDARRMLHISSTTPRARSDMMHYNGLLSAVKPAWSGNWRAEQRKHLNSCQPRAQAQSSYVSGTTDKMFLYAFVGKPKEFQVDFNTTLFSAKSEVDVAVWMLRTGFDPGTIAWDSVSDEVAPDCMQGHIERFDPSGDVEAQARALLSIIKKNPRREPISFGEVNVIAVPDSCPQLPVRP